MYVVTDCQHFNKIVYVTVATCTNHHISLITVFGEEYNYEVLII